jgi:ion channel-forming bestrophin family protein
MHAGVKYGLKEFLIWTRRNIYALIWVGLVPTVLYEVVGWTWIAMPWTVVALLGTATAFLVGFKNTQTYNRTWEARQIWGSIVNSSRAWGVMSRDFVGNNPEAVKTLFYRHFAWLTALRYQMRDARIWENSGKPQNDEYRRFYTIPEKETPLEQVLAQYLAPDELAYILTTKNRATQLLSLQSKTLQKLHAEKAFDTLQFIELEKMIKDLYDHQGKSERIKNFPYPRQFATINALFIRLFCLLLPFGMLKDFDKLNDQIGGFMAGNMVWLVVPFSVLISWVYTSLEQVGESTENPFEGGPNDVPISQISRTIEIDMREMLGETDLPPALQPKNHIVL